MQNEIARTNEFILFEEKNSNSEWRALKLERIKKLTRGKGRNIFRLSHNGKRFAYGGDFNWLVENRLPLIAWISNQLGDTNA